MNLHRLLICICITPIAAYGQSVDLFIEERTPERSYLCWKPLKAKIALTEPAAQNLDVTISSVRSTVANCTTESKGQALFRTNLSGQTSSDLVEDITISLPKSAEWIEFEIAGRFGFPSSNLNDTSIVIRDSNTGSELRNFSTTVRVRKNANCLSDNEWGRFIRTLSVLHDLENDSVQSLYAKYPITHGSAWDMAHFDSAFLPWHRAFLLALERELQMIDPMVTIPYWQFENESPNIFSLDHIGGVSNDSSGSVVFERNHPWINWRIGEEFLVDKRPGNGKQAIWVVPENEVIAGDQPYSSFRSNVEYSHHGDAHNALLGWAAGSISPADPVFFLLHAQVDRVWAKWQANSGRSLFDSTNPQAYELQGSWETAEERGNRSKGQWSKDTLWPWDGDQNEQRGRIALTELNWRGHMQPEEILFPVRSGYAPSGVPTVGEMIDYKNLGYCYDNVQIIEEQ